MKTEDEDGEDDERCEDAALFTNQGAERGFLDYQETKEFVFSNMQLFCVW